MNTLEMYRRLSNDDKGNLTIYCIYDSIYSIAKYNDVELEDGVVKNIQELSYDLWLDDEYLNLSETKISDFITQCYINDNSFLKKLEDIDYSDLLQAVEDDNYDFYKDNELER